MSEMWWVYPLVLRRDRRRHLVPAAIDAHDRRHHAGRRARVLQLGGPARPARQGARVEPAHAAVLVPVDVPARGDRRGGGHPPARARCVVGRPGRWPRRRRVGRRRAASPSPTSGVAVADARRAARRRHRGADLEPRPTPPTIDENWCRAAAPRAGEPGHGDGARRRDRAARGDRGVDRHLADVRPSATSCPTGPSTTTPGTRAAPTPRSPRSRGRSTARSWTPRTSLAAGPHGVGARRRHRRVRHTARADAAAVLDPRPHRLDGGPLLRGVGHHAVPLHDDRRRSRRRRRTRCAACPTSRSPTSTSGCATCRLMGVQLLRRVHRPGEAGRGEEPRRSRWSRPCPTSTASRRAGGTSTRSPTRPLVAPLKYRPVVVDDMQAEESWKCERRHAARRRAPRRSSSPRGSARRCRGSPTPPRSTARSPTAGPASWQRASTAKARTVAKEPLPEVEVTNVHTTDSSISFDVSRTGVPVMVKTSYFPNWEVEGAKGPCRATPNFMVVVPTSHHVELTYGTTSAEWAGRFLTLVGLVGLGGLVWWGMRRRRRLAGAPRGPLTICAKRTPETPDPAMPRRVGSHSRFPAVRTRGPLCPTPRSTPSSRPTTSAASTRTRSTRTSPAGSATPSSRSPAPPACSSVATPVRRRSRSSRRSSRAR